jgi:hypothetical protein
MSPLVVAAVVLDVALLVFVAALVCCLVRRWQLAGRLATAVALAGAAVLLFVAGRLLVVRSGAESPSRAVLPLVLTLAGLTVRAFARRRVR